jgi:hypothetical protein
MERPFPRLARAVALAWDGALDKERVRGQIAAFCSGWDEVLENIAAIMRERATPA